MSSDLTIKTGQTDCKYSKQRFLINELIYLVLCDDIPEIEEYELDYILSTGNDTSFLLYKQKS